MRILLLLLFFSVRVLCAQNMYESILKQKNLGMQLTDFQETRYARENVGEYFHRLRPDDKLSISIWGHDDLSVGSLFGIYNSNEVYGKWLLVEPDSTVMLPALGRLRLGGLTLREAQDTLTQVLGKQVKDPQVVVRLLNREVTLMGEIKNPGTVTLYKERNFLPEALSAAGGLNYYADTRKVVLLRKVGFNQYEKIKINLRKPQTDNEIAPLLRSGDVIYVPARKRLRLDKDLSSIVSVSTVLTGLAVLFTVLTR